MHSCCCLQQAPPAGQAPLTSKYLPGLPFQSRHDPPLLVLTGCNGSLKQQLVRPFTRSDRFTEAQPYTSPSSGTTVGPVPRPAAASPAAVAVWPGRSDPAAAAVAAGVDSPCCCAAAGEALPCAARAPVPCLRVLLRAPFAGATACRCCCCCICSSFCRRIRAAEKGAGSGSAVLSCTCSWSPVDLQSCINCCWPTSQPRRRMGAAKVAVRTARASLS